jgi:hypothetical protein
MPDSILGPEAGYTDSWSFSLCSGNSWDSILKQIILSPQHIFFNNSSFTVILAFNAIIS